MTQTYCTKTDIEAIWPAASLLASVDDDTSGSLSATEEGYITRAIERAANILNARLEVRYRVADLAGNTWEAPTSPSVFSTDGRQQILVHEQRLEIRNLVGEQARIPPLAIDGPAAGAVVSLDGRSLLTASLAQDGLPTNLKARLWSTQNGQPLGPAFLLTEDHTRAVLSPNGTYLFTAAGDTAEIWDALNGKRLHVLPHLDPLKGITCGPTGPSRR